MFYLALPLFCFILFTEPAYAMENLNEKSIGELQQSMQAGSLTAVEVTQYYLSRIEQYNDELNAVIRINPEALSTAAALDSLGNDKPRGLLHGIPVLLKDNIDTGDGMPNTAGSVLLLGNVPAEDAFVVQQLRAAGAIILGKANLSEWANFRSLRASSGWSGVGGQTRNPYDVTRSPCGSSSGSGAAVTANLTAVAIGTETDGSVICPAAMMGLVGIKPGLGTVSRTGIIPLAHSQDTAGPMARTVEDAVVLLTAMTEIDQKDPLHQPASADYLAHLNLDGLKGKTLGVVENLMGYHDQLDEVFESQRQALEKAGAILTSCKIPNRRHWGDPEYEVLLYEFKADIQAYLKDRDLPYKHLGDLIEGNQTHAGQELDHFGQEIFLAANAKGGLDEAAYKTALADSKRLAGPEGIDAALKICGADILIAPTTSPAWKIDHVMGDHYAGGAASAAAISGYPHITVPMGQVKGLPVGLSFFAGANSEGKLIEAAYAFEQATRYRTAPTAFP